MSGLARPMEWLLNWFRGDTGGGDVTVNNNTFQTLPAVWYAIQKISGDIGKMPVEPRRSMKGGKGSEVARDVPSYRLLRDEPNKYQTSDVFKELIQSHALGWGNGRAAIIRSGVRPVELIPMLPDRSDTLMVEGQKYHITVPCEDDPLAFAEIVEETIRTGHIHKDMIVLHDRDVLHIMGLGTDGVKGCNIGRVFADALGTGLSGQRLMRKQMAKGFTAKVLLKDAGNVFGGPDGEKAAQDFLKQFREKYTADGNGEVSGMLRKGMEAETLNMSNADAQLIEQMRYSRQDVMLIFGLPHIPGDDSATSYNSLEHQQLQYLASSLDRWIVRWEMQCDAKLRTDSEKRAGLLYHKFNTATWLKTDAATTATVLATHIRARVINPNEAREKLDMNPYDGGDEFVNPAIAVKEDASEPKEKNQERARNKMLELVPIEAKRVVDIVNGKKIDTAKEFEDAVTAFYGKWCVTLQNALGPDSAFDETHYTNFRLADLRQAIENSTDTKSLRKNVAETVSHWIKET